MFKKLKFNNIFKMKYENCFQIAIKLNFVIIRSTNSFIKFIKKTFIFLNSFKKKLKNKTFKFITSISFK